jgi:hypothetical protein
MTREQAALLGQALIAWSENRAVRVRTTAGPDQSWYAFTPDSYEKLNVEAGLEWAVESHPDPREAKPWTGSIRPYTNGSQQRRTRFAE